MRTGTLFCMQRNAGTFYSSPRRVGRHSIQSQSNPEAQSGLLKAAAGFRLAVRWSMTHLPSLGSKRYLCGRRVCPCVALCGQRDGDTSRSAPYARRFCIRSKEKINRIQKSQSFTLFRFCRFLMSLMYVPFT